MKKFAKLVALGMALVMAAGVCAVSFAEEGDFDAMLPLMDLVSAASRYSANAPESVPGSEGVLSASFTNAFILMGTRQCADVGVTEAMLTDTSAQAALLSSIFAAELPALEVVPDNGESMRFVGFYPKTMNTLEDGSIQIIGEIYMADKAMREMTDAEYADVTWLDRAIYTFKTDATAMNGFRLEEYSFGLDLAYEEEFQSYSESVSVEYVSDRGFSFLYPADFDDELLLEDETGVSAVKEDGSAGFWARRIANENYATLESFVQQETEALAGCTVRVFEDMQYATSFYIDENYYIHFTVYVVTNDYIYQAQLYYLNNLAEQYSMFNSYLENSFVVAELYQG